MSQPLSLRKNPDTFTNWDITARGDVPDDMPWVEWLGDSRSSPGIFQASANQPSAAQITFATPFANFLDYNADILLSLLGGYNEDAGGMCVPWQSPYPGPDGDMYVTDVKVGWVFPDNSTVWTPGSPFPFRLALYTVTFQALPYGVAFDYGSAANLNWCEFRNQSSNETYQIPPGYYLFASGSGAPHEGASSVLGTYVNGSIGYVEVIAHRIPINFALTSGPSAGRLSPYLSMLNNDTIMGATPGQLKLDSYEMAPYGDWQAQNVYDIHMYFQYKYRGWNTGLDTDGQWYPIVSKDGGDPPLATTSFKTMLATIIPPNV